MEYFIREIQTEEGVQKTAGIKARDDLEVIFSDMGMQPIEIPMKCVERASTKGLGKISGHQIVKQAWVEKLDKLSSGDTVYIQFPVIEHSIFLPGYIKKLKQKNIQSVVIIHDLEILRVAKRQNTSFAKKMRLKMEELNMLKNCSKIIAHNEKMKEFLCSLGISENKIVSLEIFDYLVPDCEQEKLDAREFRKDLPIIIAGTLRKHKAAYAYKLPETVAFNLFGVGYEGPQNDKITYFGSFYPDELPYALTGSFGLVWDGTEADTCTGVYGDYLKINNPHKTSLYLASEVPVVIWKEAALADFIEKNHCGIVVESIADIPNVIENMTTEEYETLRQGTKDVAAKIRSGFFTRQAVQNKKYL